MFWYVHVCNSSLVGLLYYSIQTLPTRSEVADKWEHDLYVEEEQVPRTPEEKRRVSHSLFTSSACHLALQHSLYTSNITDFMKFVLASKGISEGLPCSSYNGGLYMF